MKKIILLILTLVFSIFSHAQLANESFEGATFPPTTPANWAIFDNGLGGTTNVNWATNSVAANVNSGLKAAFMTRQVGLASGNIVEEYLATPAITVPVNGQLKFFTRTLLSGINFGTKYLIKVKPVAAGAQNDPTGYATIQQWDDSNFLANYQTYEEKTLPLAGAGTQVYIAFVLQQTGNGSPVGNRWLVDDVKVVATCTAPAVATFTAGAITNATATLGWGAVAGAVGYEIENILTTQLPTGVATGTSATNTFLQTGLTGVTNYQFYVRSDCGGGNFSAWSGPFIYATTVAPPVCGGNFYDSGASTANYGNNENITTTICPSVAGQQVTVNFSAFNTQAGSDILKIYNNNSATVASLIGSYSGTTSPGSITATNPTGCLTFVFTSNATTTASGWASTITCAAPPSCQKPIALQATAVLSTTATLSWGAIANATSYEIFYQTCGLPAPTAASVAQATSQTNTVNLTGLSANTCYDFYVRSVCPGNDFSLWSNAASATTQVLPPVCGGNYVDSGGSTGNYSNNENITTTICPNVTSPNEKVTVTFLSFDTEATYDGIYVYDGSVVSPLFQIASTNPVGNGFPAVLTETGAFWGTTIPGPFTSTSADGCLTFVFKSEGSGVGAGWTANISCALPPNCVAPNQLSASGITATAATIGWSQLPNPNNTTASAWEYIVLPSPSTAPTSASVGTASSSTSVPLSPLLSNTCYDLYVRAICSSTESSTWSGPKNFCTLIAPPICGGNYVDSGGSNGNYSNNENITTTICPNVTAPNEKVTVTFLSFDTEATYDGIYVYDGQVVSPLFQIASTNPVGNGPQLTTAGAFWGTTIPGPFTSTSADGCLTFIFKSEGSGVRAGWTANISCALPPNCVAPNQLSASGITATAATIGWLQLPNPNNTTASAWEYIVLPSPSTAPTSASVGTASSSTSVLLSLLLSNTCYDFYVRAICSTTESSTWSGPKNFCTLIAPPVCGGNFVDNGGSANYLNGSNTTTVICPDIPGQLVTVTFTSFNTEDTWDGLYVYDGNLPLTPTSPQISSLNGPTNIAGSAPGSFWGVIPTPFSFTSSAADGCLTFKFISDPYVNRAGWTSNVTCGPPPPCRQPNALTATATTQTGVTLGWAQLPNPDASISTAWQYLILPSGAPAPTATSTGWVDTNSNSNNVITNLTSATCYDYYVRSVCSSTNSSFWAGPKKFCTLIQNDECDFATVLTVNPDIVCTTTASGSLVGATASNQPNTCAGSADDDVWFKFVATSTSHLVTISNVAGSTTNLDHAVFQGTNCANLTQIYCSPTDQSQATNLTIGATYYIRVFSNTATPGQTTTFNICVGTQPPVPLCLNSIPFTDDCPNATPICNFNGYCGNTSAYTDENNWPELNTAFCGSIENNSFATFVASSTTLSLNFWVTSSTLGYGVQFMLFSAANCGSGPVNVISCYSPAGGTVPIGATNITANNLIVGNTYYFMVDGFAGDICSYVLQPAAGGGGIYTSVAVTAPRTTICLGSSVNLTATGGNSIYTWSPSTGLNQTTGSPVIFTPTSNGTFTFTATATDGNTACPNSTSASITITVADPVAPVTSFSYSTPICRNLSSTATFTNPILATSFATGGVYSCLDNNLIINSTTGAIDLSSPTGTYTVTYNVAADPSNCFTTGSSTATITIVDALVSNTNFSYTTPVCKKPDFANPILDPAFTAGGIFSSTTGLVINPNTGIVDLDASSTGIYTVLYNTPAVGACSVPAQGSAQIEIVNQIIPVVGFSYTSPVCRDILVPSGFVTPNATGAPLTANGIFTCTDPALILNASTGAVDLSSPAGNYTITYTVAANATACLASNSSQATLTINPIITPITGFSYSLTTVCSNAASLTPITSPGFTTGGTYSATPSGLVINPTTGEISNTSISGTTYTITYEVLANTNICQVASSSSTTLRIDPVIVAASTLSYSTSNIFCAAAVNNPLPTLNTTYTYDGIASTTIPTPNPNVSFIYTATPSGLPGLDINANTGQINLATSAPGTYVITYTSTGATPNCYSGGSAQVTVTITGAVTQVANFSYASPVCKSDLTNPIPNQPFGFANGGNYTSSTGLILNPNTGEINLSASTAGTYTVNYVLAPDLLNCLAGAVSSASITINANVLPTFTQIQPLCQGDALPVLLTTSNNSINGVWSTTAIDTKTPGTITYNFVPNAGQCALPTSMMIVVKANPVFTIAGACQGGAYTLEVSGVSANAIYTWYKETTLLGISTPTLVITEIANYFCKVTEDGCPTLSQAFTPTDIICSVQKGISPNGDGLNDEFDLSSFDVNKLEIFNRYGMLVYSKSGYKKEWAGQADSGVALPDGTYFYVINLNKGEAKTGWVYINKENNN